MTTIMVSALKTIAASSVSKQKAVMFIAKSHQQDLAFLAELIATGKMTSVIERTYRLEETPDAVAHLERGHARGKVVVQVTG
jgi:NADPH:quinone reductase-like Zn-dependent oxidoreductase